MVLRSKFIRVASKALQGLKLVLSPSLCLSPPTPNPSSVTPDPLTALWIDRYISYFCAFITLLPQSTMSLPPQPPVVTYRLPCFFWNLTRPLDITQTAPNYEIFLLCLSFNQNLCLPPLCFPYHACIHVSCIHPCVIHASTHPSLPFSMLPFLFPPLSSFFPPSIPPSIHLSPNIQGTVQNFKALKMGEKNQKPLGPIFQTPCYLMLNSY